MTLGNFKYLFKKFLIILFVCISYNCNSQSNFQDIFENILSIISDSIIPESGIERPRIHKNNIKEIEFIKHIDILIYGQNKSCPKVVNFFTNYFDEINRFKFEDSERNKILIPLKLRDNIFRKLFFSNTFILERVFSGYSENNYLFMFRFSIPHRHIGYNLFILYCRDSGLKEYCVIDWVS